jgi:hypothetical protein
LNKDYEKIILIQDKHQPLNSLDLVEALYTIGRFDDAQSSSRLSMSSCVHFFSGCNAVHLRDYQESFKPEKTSISDLLIKRL